MILCEELFLYVLNVPKLVTYPRSRLRCEDQSRRYNAVLPNTSLLKLGILGLELGRSDYMISTSIVG